MATSTVFGMFILLITSQGPVAFPVPVIFENVDVCKEAGPDFLKVANKAMEKKGNKVEYAAFKCTKFVNVPEFKKPDEDSSAGNSGSDDDE